MPAKRRRAARPKRRRIRRKRGVGSTMRRRRTYKKLRRVRSTKGRVSRFFGQRVRWPSGTYSTFGTAGLYSHNTSNVALTFNSQLFTLTPSGLDFFSELSQLYRWYKVLSLTVTLTPYVQRDALGISHSQGQIIMVPLYDPTEAFTMSANRASFEQFMGLKGAKRFKWPPPTGKSFSITIYPKILMLKYYGWNASQYTYKPIRSWWNFIEASNNTPVHFGLGIYSYFPTDIAPHGRHFDISFHMKIRCAGRPIHAY